MDVVGGPAVGDREMAGAAVRACAAGAPSSRTATTARPLRICILPRSTSGGYADGGAAGLPAAPPRLRRQNEEAVRAPVAAVAGRRAADQRRRPRHRLATG